MPRRILLVEDEASLAAALADNLRIEGYEVDISTTAEQGLQRLEQEDIDLLILDVMLPGMDGRQMLQGLRRQGKDLPVLMLTALGSERDAVRGLDAGADDYLSKPFGLSELFARVRALLRRLRGDEGLAVIHLGDRRVDFNAACVSWSGHTLQLTRLECDILQLLASAAGAICSREQIIDACWPDDPASTRTVDMHIRRLRTKLESNAAVPEHLLTVHGQGYRLRTESVIE